MMGRHFSGEGLDNKFTKVLLLSLLYFWETRCLKFTIFEHVL